MGRDLRDCCSIHCSQFNFNWVLAHISQVKRNLWTRKIRKSYWNSMSVVRIHKQTEDSRSQPSSGFVLPVFQPSALLRQRSQQIHVESHRKVFQPQ